MAHEYEEITNFKTGYNYRASTYSQECNMMTFYGRQDNVSVKSYLPKYMLNDNCNE